MRFHMPTHSAPLRPLRPTFPDNEMRGSFRVRKKKKLCLLNLNAHLISLFLKEPRKEAKYHQIILGKSSATTLPPLISPRLASPRLPYLTTPGDFYCSSIAPMDTRTMAGEGGRKEGGGVCDGNGGKTGVRGLHSRGPGVNHLLRWASETHAHMHVPCTADIWGN